LETTLESSDWSRAPILVKEDELGISSYIHFLSDLELLLMERGGKTMAQMVEYLLSQALSSNPSSGKQTKGRRKLKYLKMWSLKFMCR
jgi:hypothetical protein